jgi:hypothetical protein
VLPLGISNKAFTPPHYPLFQRSSRLGVPFVPAAGCFWARRLTRLGTCAPLVRQVTMRVALLTLGLLELAGTGVVVLAQSSQALRGSDPDKDVSVQTGWAGVNVNGGSVTVSVPGLGDGTTTTAGPSGVVTGGDDGSTWTWPTITWPSGSSSASAGASTDGTSANASASASTSWSLPNIDYGGSSPNISRPGGLDYNGYIGRQTLHNGDQNPVCALQTSLTHNDLMCFVQASWYAGKRWRKKDRRGDMRRERGGDVHGGAPPS